MGSITKVAVVTGGGSGIGRAVALTLAGEGYSVVVAGVFYIVAAVTLFPLIRNRTRASPSGR